MSAHSAWKDRDNALTAQTIPIGLTNLFGVTLDSFQTYQPPSHDRNGVRLDDGTLMPVQVFAEIPSPGEAKVVGRWERDYLKGLPAMTEHPFGKGKAVAYGSLFNLESARALMKRYAGEAGLKPIVDDASEEIEVTRRIKGRAEFCFLLNHGDKPAEATAGDGYTDALTDEKAEGALKLAPFGRRVLRRDRPAN